MTPLYKVTRNGNIFQVAKSNCGHYHIALMLGDIRVHSWHRTSLKHIKEYYKKVED